VPIRVVCNALLQSSLQSLLRCCRSRYICRLCVQQCIAVLLAIWRVAQLVVEDGNLLAAATQPGVRPHTRQQHSWLSCERSAVQYAAEHLYR
jgi:hypothetical protein